MKLKMIIGFAILVLIVAAAVWRWSRRDLSPNEPAITATSTPALELMTVKVFFGNRVNDPQTLFCERTYPTVRQVSKTAAPAQAALEQLLAGPTAKEQAQGFFTALNSGVVLRSLSIKSGVAYADFDARLGEGVGGSCLVTAIRAQIENTLKQFPSVASVVISIDGQVDDVLQP